MVAERQIPIIIIMKELTNVSETLQGAGEMLKMFM